jgi:serine/threonine-protein kinase
MWIFEVKPERNVMNKKIACFSLLTLLLPLSACAVNATDTPSGSEPVDKAESALNGGPWTWVDTATGFCLDGSHLGPLQEGFKDDIYTLGCNGGVYQEWRNVPGTYGDRIIHQSSGYCLDSNTNGNVYAIPCNGGAFQQWAVTYKGAYGWQIQNVATGFCLDSNTSGHVYTLPCNNGNFQRWH